MRDVNGGESEPLAPVIPLFGARRQGPGSPAGERSEAPAAGPFFREIPDDGRAESVDPAARVAAAEHVLLRKLRARQLSVMESRTVLGGLDLDAHEVETLIDAFADRGYLDDARLAEQLIHVGTDRKGQGRRAIAQTLSSRGIPRDVADAVLAELPDDDADRALEFARTKARQLDRFDDATALRRLIGQLSRRGYPGSVAATAARTALDENRSQGGVRFR